MISENNSLSRKQLLILLNRNIYRNKACDQMEADLDEEQLQSFFKYMMKNPVNLEIQDLIRYYPWSKCIIQAKASGLRCLLVLYKGIVYLLFEATLEQIGSTPLDDLSVFECEFMTESIESQQILCYDQHMFEGKAIYQSNYFYRIWKVQQTLNQIVEVSTIDKRYVFKAKRFEQIDQKMGSKEVKKALKRVYNTPYENDGLIINTNDPLLYQRIFKWKPIEKLTIDFKCIAKQNSPNVYELMAFDPFKNESVIFTSPIIECSNIYEADPSIGSLDNKIVEFSYDLAHNEWVFVRMRDDKGSMARGNSLKVARTVMANTLYNIDFDMLCNGIGEVYFQHIKGPNYKAMTKFINEVKQNQIRTIYETLKQLNVHNPSVLDMGSGKGQDILKFQDFSTITCVDNDKYALWELNQRTSSIKTNLKVRTIQANLASWESLNLLPTNIDFLNCNLALHYFVDTLTYIVKTTNPLIINLLIFDGSKLTKEQTLYENNQVKYHYHILKKDPNRIQVKLPFRTQLTEEAIVNPKHIIEQLQYINYRLDKYESLSDIKLDIQGLTNADIQHINNYSVLQFSRLQQS